jgi:hypothetical protein
LYCQDAIAKAGAVKALVNVLNNNKEDLATVKAAALLLESLALVSSNLEVLRKEGAHDALLGVLEFHKEDHDLNVIGRRAIALIVGGNQLDQAIQAVGNILANPAALSQSAMVEKMLAAVKALGNLTMMDNNIAQLIKTGAIGKLINAFLQAIKLPNSEAKSQILAAAAGGILRLNRHGDATAQLLQNGVLKAMLQAAVNDPNNEELAQHVAELIAQIASDPKNIAALLKDGVVADLIALAKAHPLNEQILASVTRALGLLCQDGKTIQQAIKAGAAEIIVEAIFANLLKPDLLANALQVMNQMLVDDEAIQAFLDAGAIDAILETMRCHHDKAEILAACCQSLCRLLMNESVAADIGNKGGLPLCVRAMRDHFKSEGLCEIDMILLDSLASLKENTTKLLDAELSAIELVKWVGKQYPNNNSLNEALARLLASLTADEKRLNNPEIKDLSDAQCDILIKKFQQADKDKAGALAALNQLIAALADPHNAALMIARGGLQTLANLINSSTDNENLFYAAAAAFLALTDSNVENLADLLDNPAVIGALCNMINAHQLFSTPMNLNDLTRAVKAAGKIKLKGAAVKEILKNQPLNSLMKILLQSDDPLLLAQTAKLLGKLSNNNDAALLLSKLANLRELIQAMRRNIQNEEFLKYAVYLLGNLAVNEEIKSQIGIEGGIQLILQIMELYPQNEGLIENCAYALANLSFGSEVNVSFIVACKGVNILLSAMLNHSRSEELLESCVCVLCNLCHKNDSNKDLIIKSNGSQQIVDCVLNNFNAIELLLTCFRTLGNLAYDSKSTGAIIKAGGVQAIVAGMTVHAAELDIIDIAIRVLTNLASDPTEENMRIMAQEGAVQAIVEVASNYTDKLEIMIAALGCLCNLGRQLDNAQMIIKQNGVEATQRAMKKLEFDINLVGNAVRLINVLAHTKQAELQRMLETNIVASLVQAMKQHGLSRTVISNGLMALTLLSYNNEAANKIAAAGVIQLILRLVQDNLKSAQVLSECFPALSALSRSEGNAISMSELAMKSLQQAIQLHNTDVKFLCFCFSFLSNLCVHSDATVAVLNTQLAAATLDTILRHKGETNLITRADRALENMCYSTKEVKDHLREAGIEGAMERCINDNAGNDEVRTACKAVLDALNRADIDLSPLEMKSFKIGKIEVRSAKKIFGDDGAGNDDITELPLWVRNLLLAGQLLIKHSNTAAPRSRHVYVTNDLKFLVWKDPKEQLHPDNKMKIFKVRSVEKGRATPQLQRKTLLGKWLAKEECAFAIIGRDRTVDLEAANEAERDKWVEALEMLVAYRKALKKVNTQFGAV